MNIEEFYVQDERRRASREIEFGRLVVSLLGVVTSHERLEEVLVGWPEAMAGPEGVEWLAATLRAAGVVKA